MDSVERPAEVITREKLILAAENIKNAFDILTQTKDELWSKLAVLLVDEKRPVTDTDVLEIRTILDEVMGKLDNVVNLAADVSGQISMLKSDISG